MTSPTENTSARCYTGIVWLTAGFSPIYYILPISASAPTIAFPPKPFATKSRLTTGRFQRPRALSLVEIKGRSVWIKDMNYLFVAVVLVPG